MKKFTLCTLALTMGMFAFADPDSPTEFKMNFDINGGDPTVTGSFVTPLYQWGWQEPKTPIEKITKIEVLRSCDDINESEKPVYVFEGELEPGSTVEFTDTKKGWQYGHEYSYYARVYDENDTKGFGKSCYLYIGIKPDKPEFSVATADNGQLPVTLTVTAPTKTSDGKELSVPLKELLIVQYVNGFGEMELTSITDPEPGKSYTWEHEDADIDQKYSYRAYAVCDYGKSDAANAEIYVGMDAPAAPSDVEVVKNKDNSVSLSWKAPVKGANGGVLDSSSIRYSVTRLGSETKQLAENLTECKFTDTLEDMEGPENVEYKITASNNVGNGGSISTDEYVVGPAYKLPFAENFNSRSGWFRSPDKIWTIGSNWSMTDSSLYDIPGVDADDETSDAYAYSDLRYSDPGAIESMTSYSIDFKDASYPVATFYAASKKNEYSGTLEAGVKDDENTETLLSFLPAEEQTEGKVEWKRHILPLEKAAGKEMSFFFTTIIPEDADPKKIGDIGVDKLIIADYPGVAKISFSTNDGVVTVKWEDPKNSFDETPDSYDFIIDGGEEQNTIDPEFSFNAPEETRAETVAKVTIRANYGDIRGKYSPEFDILIGEDPSSVTTIVDGVAAKVEYFDINGYAVANPVKGSTIIRRSISKDGNVKIEKMIAK